MPLTGWQINWEGKTERWSYVVDHYSNKTRKRHVNGVVVVLYTVPKKILYSAAHRFKGTKWRDWLNSKLLCLNQENKFVVCLRWGKLIVQKFSSLRSLKNWCVCINRDSPVAEWFRRVPAFASVYFQVDTAATVIPYGVGTETDIRQLWTRIENSDYSMCIRNFQYSQVPCPRWRVQSRCGKLMNSPCVRQIRVRHVLLHWLLSWQACWAFAQHN